MRFCKVITPEILKIGKPCQRLERWQVECSGKNKMLRKFKEFHLQKNHYHS